MRVENRVSVFGTAEDLMPMRQTRVGSLSFFQTPDALRCIRWGETELVRAVTWPVRDQNWGTWPQNTLESNVDGDETSFSGKMRFSVADEKLECLLTIDASADGILELQLTMTPNDGPFLTNRAGFTLLHPIEGIAGAPLEVTHSGGVTEVTTFPRLISPDQPVVDIRGLKYGLNGGLAEISFSGEVFEMEDQRNWSDASYKTYCVPLVHPFTYEISGATTQTVRISLSGAEGIKSKPKTAKHVQIRTTDETALQIGLVTDPDWPLGDDVIDLSGVGHVLSRIGLETPKSYLENLTSAARNKELDVEIVLSNDDDPLATLHNIRKKLETVGLKPTRVIALPKGYLGSHQPSGPWPEGPTPSDLISASQAAFPETKIGGGMLTNFTEFNRCRPDPSLCDFVTHGSTAIVHASDDLSVCETLETYPHIFESVWTIAEDTAYRLSLVSIGMRSNPYGSAVAENPHQIRRTMAQEDPRQQGLFAAAWAVGVLSSTQDYGIESICLAATDGPFGIMCQSDQQIGDLEGANVFPLFHVVREASAMSGHKRLYVDNLPDNVFAFGIKTANKIRVMLSNASPEICNISLGNRGNAVILDSRSFPKAVGSVDWLETTARKQTSNIELEGYAVAFVEF